MTTSPPAVAVVTFDAGATLFTERLTRDEMYVEVFADHGVDVDVATMESWREREHDAMPETVAGEPRYSEPWFREYVARLLRVAGARADAEDVRAALAERFVHASAYRVFDDVLPTLDALAARGLRLAVVSNWSDHLPGILDGLGLGPRFEAVFASAVVGISKPSPRLFDHACRALGVAPEACLHVGDRVDNDVEPARAAGMRAARIDRSATGDDLPDGVLRDLRDLPTLLDPPPAVA